MSEIGRQDLAVQMFELQISTMLDKGFDLVSRSIQLFGDIDEEMFQFVDSALTILENQSRRAITVKINSGGGSMYDAAAIIGRLKSSPCKIVTEGYGHVMSAATIIFASGNKRRISKWATYMHHEASYDAGGKHSEVKAWVEQFEKEEKMWAETMAQFSNQPAEFWQKHAKHTDKFFKATELVELGVADEVF